MTPKQFERMKADFLKTYKADLCEDSVEFVERADTPQAFLRILGEFVAHIGMKDLPTIDWARKWFRNDISLLNDSGIYLDQITTIKDTDQPFIFLFGNCNIMYAQKYAHFTRILARDNSSISLLLYGCGTTILRLHGEAKHNLHHKDISHTLKIHNI